MIALYAVGAAYTIALVCAAGRLYILGCAQGLRHALLAAQQRQPRTPLRIGPQPVSRPTVQAPTPVLQWPRDN